MLALPLFAATLALAPTGDSIRFSVAASGTFDASNYGAPAPGYFQGEETLAGRAGLGLTLYLRRIVDDDAPPSLQPFLQRATYFHLDGGGGGGQQTWSAAQPHVSFTQGWFDASISGYARGYLYGAAHVGVQYSDNSGALYPVGGGPLVPLATTTVVVPVDVDVGLRHGDLRLTVGWGIRPTRVSATGSAGDFHVPFWGGLRADVAGVVKKRLWLSAGLGMLDNGVSVVGSAELYLRRRFGVLASVQGRPPEHSERLCRLRRRLRRVGHGPPVRRRPLRLPVERIQRLGLVGDRARVRARADPRRRLPSLRGPARPAAPPRLLRESCVMHGLSRT